MGDKFIKYVCLFFLFLAFCSSNSIEIPTPKWFSGIKPYEFESDIDLGEKPISLKKCNVTIHDIIEPACHYGYTKKIFWLFRRLEHILGDGIILQVTFPDRRDSIYQWTIPIMIDSGHFVTMIVIAEHPSYGAGEQLFLFHSDIMPPLMTYLNIGYLPENHNNEFKTDYVVDTIQSLNCNKKIFVNTWLVEDFAKYMDSFFLLRKLDNSHLLLESNNNAENNRRDLVYGEPLLDRYNLYRYEMEVDGIFGPYPNLNLEHGFLHQVVMVFVHQDPTTKEDCYMIGMSEYVRITKNDDGIPFDNCQIVPPPIRIDHFSNPRLPSTELIPVDTYFTSRWIVPDPHVHPRNPVMDILVNVTCPPSRFKCHPVEVYLLRNCMGEPLYSILLPPAHSSSEPWQQRVSLPDNISIPMGEYCWRIEKASYFFRKISYSTPIAVLGGPIEGMDITSIWTPIGRNGFYITFPLTGTNITVSKFILKLYQENGFAEFDHLKNIEPLICTAEYEFAVPEIMTPGTKVYFDVIFGDIFNNMLFWKNGYMFRLFIAEPYEDALNGQLLSIYPFGQSTNFTIVDAELPESFSAPLHFQQKRKGEQPRSHYVKPSSPIDHLEKPSYMAIYDNFQFANFYLVVTSIVSP